MKMRWFFCALMVGGVALGSVISGCAGSGKRGSSAKTPTWIETSNKLAEEYARALAQQIPETGSQTGYREFDAVAVNLDSTFETRMRAFNAEWANRLRARLQTETDPEVKVDVRILLDNVERDIEGDRINQSVGMVPFDKVAEDLFGGLNALINEQSPKERKSSAIDRFKKYVNGFDDGGKRAPPRIEAARLRTVEKIAEYSKRSGSSKGKLFYPLRDSVQYYLDRSQQLVAGIEDRLKEASLKTGRKPSEWEADFKSMRIQLAAYDLWLQTTLLPKARTDHRLPSALYAHKLRDTGVTMASLPLAKRAREEFKRNMVIYKDLTAQIAKRDGLKDSSPKAVIQHLKAGIETDLEKVRARYFKANEDLSNEIRRRQLMTLPSKPLKIRIASEAESAVQPAPNLQIPPLVNNVGERPEFVVPVASKGKLSIDDFAFAATAKGLTAHEGRPGHDLQFSTMLDNGISMIRALYAFNSANVEGWGLYAEWLMEPSMTLDERTGLMMSRMMRNARMFLDPELQLGKLTPTQAKKIITEDIGMSTAWADLELQRYMFRMPAQATSYYFGYLKLREMRDEATKRMAAGFKEACFHDAILNAGMLPLEILQEKMRTLQCQ